MISRERLSVIAYNAITGLEEFVGFNMKQVRDYVGITKEEYHEIMFAEDNESED